MSQIVFRVQNALGHPIDGALIIGRNADVGDWAGESSQPPNKPGEFTAELAPGHYTGEVSKDGYESRVIPWDLEAPTTPGHPVTIGLDVLSTVPLPPAPPPPVRGDAIDVARAIVTAGSPDIRAWPATTRLTEFEIRADGTIGINFGKRNGPGAWPFVDGVEGGELQYTLGIGCQADGRAGPWFLATAILCISRGPNDNYVPTGPTLAPGQLPGNWYYYAGAPLGTYQPQPGERVAWFVTAGSQRRGDIHTVAERSTVIVAPFEVGRFV
jgi:hypothetical protein